MSNTNFVHTRGKAVNSQHGSNRWSQQPNKRPLALSRSQFEFFTVGEELEVIHYALVHLVNPFNYQHKEKKG